MLHFIGHVGRYETDFFIRDKVFPGGWIPSLADVIVAMEQAGLEVVDIENLRRHYALTLDAWAERFDRNWDAIHALDPKKFDERFRRIWRVYLYGCAEMFRSPAGYTHLFQIVFSRGNLAADNYPMSRAHLYRERRVSAALERHAARRDRLAARLREGGGQVGLGKETSNLFRDRAGPGAPPARRARVPRGAARRPRGRNRRSRGHGELRNAGRGLPAAGRDARGGAAAQDHHARRRGRRRRHRGFFAPLRAGARVGARARGADRRRPDRRLHARQRARRPVLRLAELLRHARLRAARGGAHRAGEALRAARAPRLRPRRGLLRGDAGRHASGRGGFHRRNGVRARPDVSHARALRRRGAVHERLHLPRHLLPLDRREARGLSLGARLHLALGHRLVLVLEEPAGAEPAGAPPVRPRAPQLAHLHPHHALEQPRRASRAGSTACRACTANR